MKKQVETKFRVSLIADEIEKGTSTGEISREFMQQWNVSIRTIGYYIAKAKEVVAERSKLQQALKTEQLALVEHRNIITDQEIEETLSAIIRGEHVLEKRVICNGEEKVIRYKPNHFDIIMAIDKLWKKRGAYPIEKKQVENQSLKITYNLSNPEDIKYIEGV
jgi:hypothetical protein